MAAPATHRSIRTSGTAAGTDAWMDPRDQRGVAPVRDDADVHVSRETKKKMPRPDRVGNPVPGIYLTWYVAPPLIDRARVASHRWRAVAYCLATKWLIPKTFQRVSEDRAAKAGPDRPRFA